MMVRSQRTTFVSLDSGAWCPARIVGPRCMESGVRVQPLPRRMRGGLLAFAVVPLGCGVGFAL